MDVCSVILAGGNGTRFWPLSRANTPKQILNISGNDTLINETIKRCEFLAPYKNCFIVTNVNQKENIKTVLLSDEINIISEPEAKNTSACILLTALKLKSKFGDGIMCVMPSDHFITNESEFKRILTAAVQIAANSDKILTLGIKPSYPATGYGYICYDNSIKTDEAFKVLEFVEKPHIDKAKEYFKNEHYLWNSGMFIFRVQVILDNFKRFLPRLYEMMLPLLNSEDDEEVLNRIYKQVPSISIDYGIMERSDDVMVIPSDIGWNDVGSFDALGSIFPPDENGNIVRGEHILIDTSDSVIYSEDTLIATIGLSDMIIVNTSDALLVCDKKEAQNVKKIVDVIKLKKLNQYL